MLKNFNKISRHYLLQSLRKGRSNGIKYFSTVAAPGTSGDDEFVFKPSFVDYNYKKVEVESSKPTETAVDYIGQYHGLFEARAYSNNIHEIREGGYVLVNEKEISALIPEGLAGEANKEFEFAGSRTWMIRDSTKLICSIIDNYKLPSQDSSTTTTSTSPINEPSNSNSTSITSSTSQYIPLSNEETPSFSSSTATTTTTNNMDHQVDVTFSKIHVPGLTDRPLLRSSIFQAYKQGHLLFNPIPAYAKMRGLAPVLPDLPSMNRHYFSLVKNAYEGKVPTKILINGREGSGKSMVLNQAILHARRNNWIVVFINDGWSQVQEGRWIEPYTLENGDIVYDNTFKSLDTLRGLYYAHHNIFKTLKIQFKEYLTKYESHITNYRQKWKKLSTIPGREKLNFIQRRQLVEDEPREVYEECDQLDMPILQSYDLMTAPLETLEDLLLLGIAIRECAGRVFIDIIRELKALTHIPIMFAIDQVNAWEVKSAYSYEFKPVPCQSICIPYALKFLFTKKAPIDAYEMNNGICLAATSQFKVEGRNFDYSIYKNSIPFIMTVPSYSQVEYLASILHYMRVHMIPPTSDITDIMAYRIHTNSNPKLVRHEAIGFFAPIHYSKYTVEDLFYGNSTDKEGSIRIENMNEGYTYIDPDKDSDLQGRMKESDESEEVKKSSMKKSSKNQPVVRGKVTVKKPVKKDGKK